MTSENRDAICRAVLAGTELAPVGEDARQISEYLAAEIRRLPDFLRLPFDILSRLFFFHALFVHGRRFARLRATEAKRHLDFWRHLGGPFGKYVLLVESLVLFRAHELEADR